MRHETYSIGELARASGVSVRTLHHYDAIGLLSPARAAANGYRVYTRRDALRLQEILFYRAAGMPLVEIATLLDHGDRIARLEAHRARLRGALADRARMLAALDRTLAELKDAEMNDAEMKDAEMKGQKPMPIDSLYTSFDAGTQADHEAWLVETYGPAMARQISKANRHPGAVPKDITGRMDALREIEAALVSAYEAGMPPEEADLAAHRAWVSETWGRSCTVEAHAGLADIYLAHPDFIARYEALSRGFSQWLPEAMRAGAMKAGAMKAGARRAGGKKAGREGGT